MLRNFSFLLPGQLAGSGRPGLSHSLREDLEFLRESKITAIVSVTEEPLEKHELDLFCFRYLHLRVPDFSPPSVIQLEKAVRFIDDVINNNGAVLVHCLMGVGRTGTVLSAYLIFKGLFVDQALVQLRSLRPGSVETSSQVQMLKRFETLIRNSGTSIDESG